MSSASHAVGVRVVVFAGVSFGTFVAYIGAFLVYGSAARFQVPDVLQLGVVVLLAKLVAAMTAGHGLALLPLAFSRRSFSMPRLVRSAFAAVLTVSVLEAAYLSESALSGTVTRGLAQLGCSLVVSLAICAVRVQRRDGFPAGSVAGTFRTPAAGRAPRG